MIRGLCLSAIALVALATPAFADDMCVTPYAPTVPDGSKATTEQMKTALDEVKAFLKASDDFQSCLVLYLNQATVEAQKNKKDVDPAIKASVLAKGDANQREKERVGGEYNAAARAYKAAHPQ
jgi:gas vesicle protein